MKLIYTILGIAFVAAILFGKPLSPISPTSMSETGKWKFFRSDGCVPAIDCGTKLMVMDTVVFDTWKFTRENEYFGKHVEDGRAVFVSPIHVWVSKVINELKKK